MGDAALQSWFQKEAGDSSSNLSTSTADFRVWVKGLGFGGP